MTKRNITFFFLPTIFFVIILVSSFFMHTAIRRHIQEEDISRPKFDAFVSNVQSGRLQLTPDKWLDVVRHERVAGDNFLQAAFGVDGLLLNYMWASLAGILSQTIVVVIFKKQLEKRMILNTTLQPTATN